MSDFPSAKFGVWLSLVQSCFLLDIFPTILVQSVCVFFRYRKCVFVCVCERERERECVCTLRSQISLSCNESSRTWELLHATPTFRVTDPDYVCSVGEKPKLLLILSPLWCQFNQQATFAWAQIIYLCISNRIIFLYVLFTFYVRPQNMSNLTIFLLSGFCHLLDNLLILNLSIILATYSLIKECMNCKA